jgi:hypothetical protein
MNLSMIFQQKLHQVFCTLFGHPAHPLVRVEVLANSRLEAVNAVPCKTSGSPGKHCALERMRPLAPPRTLRVVRIVDSGDMRPGLGRIVISGRMADVCAELDRLAAREAALLH